MAVRTAVLDFSLANPLYVAATITFYTVNPATGAKTTTLANLYAQPTGAQALPNPQTLDSQGKFKQPVYIESAVIAVVSGITIPDHETGIIRPVGSWRATWATTTAYFIGDEVKDGAAGANTKNLYRCLVDHTSGTWATDLAAAKWELSVNVADVEAAAAAAQAAQDAAEQAEADAVLAAAAADGSADAAATQATNAQNSATAAASAQVAAEAARDATLAAYDNFDDRYLGAKASAPTTDNDGNPLVGGALYFDTTDEAMKIWTGTIWVAAYVTGTDFLAKANNLSDVSNPATAFSNIKQAATESATGVAEIASQPEVDAALDDERFVTSLKLHTNRTGAATTAPATNDLINFLDASAGNAFKKATIADILALTSSATDDAARYQALLEALVRRRVHGTQGGTGLVKGHVDAYLSDTIGSASTNETYNSTGKYYENPGWSVTSSTAGAWSGSTAHYSYTADDIQKTNPSQTAIYTTNSVSGDFEFEATVRYSTVGGSEIYMGVFAASEVGTWSATDAGNTRAMTNSFAIRMSDANIWYGAANVAALSYASGDVFKIKRVGSTLSLYRNGTLFHTWSQTFSGDVKLFLQGYDLDDAWNNVSWRVPAVAPSMTLQGSAVAATAVPTTAWVVALVDPVSAVTYNTDYTVEVTSNNGTNWDAVTLTNVGSYDGTYDILAGKVTLTGGSTNMNYRKKSLNNKELRDAGIAMMWG